MEREGGQEGREQPDDRWATFARDMAVLGGLVSLISGVWAIYWPAALIALGVLLMIGGLVGVFSSSRAPGAPAQDLRRFMRPRRRRSGSGGRGGGVS